MHNHISKPKGSGEHQRRRYQRYNYQNRCVIHRENRFVHAEINDISRGGARVMLRRSSKLTVGKAVTLAIRDFDPIDAQVCWRQGGICGVQFLSSVDKNPALSELLTRFEAAGAA